MLVKKTDLFISSFFSLVIDSVIRNNGNRILFQYRSRKHAIKKNRQYMLINEIKTFE